MAALNGTQAGSRGVTAGYCGEAVTGFQLEKTSCSFRGKIALYPLGLIGRRIRIAQLLESDYGDGPVLESSIGVSTVLAVHLGAQSLGSGSSLLLQDDASSDPYYADLSRITILDVCDVPIQCDGSLCLF
ncbi:hypothetical protein QOT71_20330 [Pseudomonas aeruginosa]|uniref:hypothetical protein n=1 Tax=Pseudomonas aeruginosa TaxID=287 RepID=UPI00106751C7|nr:hypothetical protein [Pseudomonas aeruginosa]TER07756.1 hypothetical protein IPC48_22670 [Pseudomonas aeruginosa]